MFLLWHPSLTAINLSYTFPILETSATALCGTTGIYSNVRNTVQGHPYGLEKLLEAKKISAAQSTWKRRHTKFTYQRITSMLSLSWSDYLDWQLQLNWNDWPFLSTHSIHGTGVFTYIYHRNQPNAGQYAIHGCYGVWLKIGPFTSHSFFKATNQPPGAELQLHITFWAARTPEFPWWAWNRHTCAKKSLQMTWFCSMWHAELVQWVQCDHPKAISPKTLSQVEMYPFTSINFHNSSTIPAPATNGIARKLQVIALGARPVACRFNGGNPKAPRKTTSSRCGSCAWSGFLLIGHVAWLAHFNMLNVLISRGIGEPRNVQSSWASCWSLYIALSSV